MSVCPRCQSRVKDWNGSDPECAFPDGVFVVENWNCATMNALRDVVEDTPFAVYCEDQRVATIPVPSEATYVLLGWYKHRGRTEYASEFNGSSTPVALTLALAEKCIAESKRADFDLVMSRPDSANGAKP